MSRTQRGMDGLLRGLGLRGGRAKHAQADLPAKGVGSRNALPMGGRPVAFLPPQLSLPDGQLTLQQRDWRARGFAEQANQNVDCSPVAIAELLGSPRVSLRELRDRLAGHDVLLIGNSVTRNLYFTLKTLLELAGEVSPALLETNLVFALISMTSRSTTYRAKEKKACTPTNPNVATCTSLIGGTRVSAHWNTTGEASEALIASARAAAAARGARLALVFHNTVMAPLSLGPRQSLRAASRRTADSITRAAAQHARRCVEQPPLARP